jgi:hypothetical protein
MQLAARFGIRGKSLHGWQRFSNGGACASEPFEWIAAPILREGMDKGQIKPYSGSNSPIISLMATSENWSMLRLREKSFGMLAASLNRKRVHSQTK